MTFYDIDKCFFFKFLRKIQTTIKNTLNFNIIDSIVNGS